MSSPSLVLKKKILGIFVLFLSISILLIGRTAYIQFCRGEELQKEAIEQQTRDKMISSKRGTIYDRNGKVLAVSATAETISAVPNEVKENNDPEFVSKEISNILGMDYETVYNKITENSAYVLIKRKVDKDEADKVRKFISENNVKGIKLVEDTKRYYPYGNFASHVIGFTGTDNQGLNGIEMIYDKYLKGLPGRIVSAKNAIGTEMPYKYEKYINPEDGANVVLTIDEAIQHFVEKHLETAVIENKVQNGGASIVMDVKTGEILAMAVKPDFDLNNPFDINNEEVKDYLTTLSDDKFKEEYEKALLDMWRNKCVNDSYEPGSTFKIITSSTALEEGVVEPDDKFTCTGSIEVNGKRIKCWRHYRPHGLQTFVQGVQNSCNPVFVRVGLDVGAETFYKYIKAFGFRERTGIELAGEAVGPFHKLENFKELELATATFGQGFQITPLQMITAVSAVANNGTLMKPTIVKQLTDNEGNVIKRFEPEVVRQVISEETSRTMREILESVVSEGTGKNAYVKGYRIAGKTGTSEKLPRGQEKYIASFVAFAPANDPQIAVLIMLDEPKGDEYYGGVIAAPVAGKILKDTLQYLGVEPQYSDEEDIVIDVDVPEVRNMEIEKAKQEILKANLKYKIEGYGSTVLDQTPKSGTMLPEDSMVILYTQEDKIITRVEVPDVKNKSVLDANKVLTDAGLNIRISGFGTAIEQNPEAGTKVTPGSIVNVEFRILEVD